MINLRIVILKEMTWTTLSIQDLSPSLSLPLSPSAVWWFLSGPLCCSWRHPGSSRTGAWTSWAQTWGHCFGKRPGDIELIKLNRLCWVHSHTPPPSGVAHQFSISLSETKAFLVLVNVNNCSHFSILGSLVVYWFHSSANTFHVSLEGIHRAICPLASTLLARFRCLIPNS